VPRYGYVFQAWTFLGLVVAGVAWGCTRICLDLRAKLAASA